MGLSPVVWLELVLLLAALFAVIFGGAWILRWFFSRRRASTDEVGDGNPELKILTVEVETVKDGWVSARYVSDGLTGHSGAPAIPPPRATLAQLRDAVDAAIVAWYGANVAPETMVVDYAMYPWKEGKIPKDLAKQIGTDWLAFAVEESGGRFSATNKETGLAATAESLDALPPAVQAAIATSWQSLARDVPGVLTWQRTLTDEGFAPYH